jgi:hypothetical protein
MFHFRAFARAMSLRLCPLLGAFAVSACSDDAASEPALDDNQKLSTLTDAQLGALCDWSNSAQGGYDKDVLCKDGVTTVPTQKDQAACKAEDGPILKKCEQTVATYKACTLRLATDPCDTTNGLTSKECLPFLPCLVP